MGLTTARGLLVATAFAVGALAPARAFAQERPPELTAPVNDFAGVIDAASASALDTLSRALLKASGDVVVVATVRTFKPWDDIRPYATAMFENRGKGIGARGKDNGLLVLVAVDDRRVWVEVGYDLESIITDGFAGETSRQVMAPRFRDGQYGAGLVEGTSRMVARIARARNVQVTGVPADEPSPARPESIPAGVIVLIVIALLVIMQIRGGGGGGPRRRWRGGVGPWGGPSYGGTWGGGSTWRGSGGLGGFGGFGGGRSGGGGGGASW